MDNNAFNLVDEPWICLLSGNGKVTKEGLKNVFLNAQDYLDLGGEIRLQDMAVLRLLIAISVRLLYTYDENGVSSDLKDWKQALKRFHAVWQGGKFPEKAVRDYFERWHDRFNLFDDDCPFFQISLKGLDWGEDNSFPDGKKPIYDNGVYLNWMPIANINGRIQSSRNKPNAPYKDLAGQNAERADYDEAARWLVFYNAYSDCTVGKRQHFLDPLGQEQSANASMTLPSRGSLVTPVGHCLFETIMLNSVLFDPIRRDLYASVRPVWEETVIPEILIDIPVPNDLPRMYTQQARRISLKRDEGKVVGAFISAGESYSRDLLWMEPAFMMHEMKDKETKQTSMVPMSCGSETDIWREIEHIAGDKGARITEWINVLQDYEEEVFSEERVIPFRVTGISYGSMNCGIQSMTEDRITLSRQFLRDSELQADAVNEIERINSIAKIIVKFGNDCARCMNFSDNFKDSKNAKIGKLLSEKYVGSIGYEFRRYLSGDLMLKELKKAEFDLARKAADQFIEGNVKALLRGKPGKDGMFLGKAEDRFKSGLSKLERR